MGRTQLLAGVLGPVPHTSTAADVLATEVPEGGQVVELHAGPPEDGAGGRTFSRDPSARGPSGGGLVTDDARAGLVAAIGATPPGVRPRTCPTR